jgi:deoxycytidylate deaminase
MKLPSYFREANRASKQSDHPHYKVGACIVYKGRVLSVGFNQILKNHPLTRMFNEHQSIHAEVSSIIRLKKKKILKECKMVVYREYANGELAMSRPCPTCIKILKFFGIKKIIYTTIDGYSQETIM